MKTEIITIGDEILLGQIVDSNAKFISEKLASVGADVNRITTIGDGDDQIINTIHEALTRADLVITTGGLGPTDDDLTKYALCKAFNRKIVFHQEIYDLVMQRYELRGLIMPEIVRTQAEQPEGAILFENPLGSALGILIKENDQLVISLPGVPQEMKAIIENSVLPHLKDINHGFHVIYKNIQTFGTFESYISDLLFENKFSHDGCDLAYLPAIRGVRIRLTYKGTDREQGKNLVEKYSSELIRLLGDYYVSDDGRDLKETTADLLKATGKTVSTAESCTGGMVAAALTDIPGSSAYFIEGAVTYANEAKTDMLDIPQEILMDKGAVSEDSVRLMADNMRKKAGTDYSLAVSGIAGPTGGSDDKPVGLIYIGISSNEGTEVHQHFYGKDRHINRKRTVYQALNYLRLKLIKL
jgi:competence/damage-inducible protein CinA-like protein